MRAEKPYTVQNITKIKSLIQDNMIIEDMILYRYSEYDDMLDIICDEEFVPTTLENSFLEYTIDSRQLEFDNHIKSNKYYKSKLDNPKDLIIRGLLMFPIIKAKKTIGVLSMYRSSRQNINFTYKDEYIVKNLEPLLCKLINEENIEDDELLVFDNIDQKKSPYSKKEINTKKKKEIDKSSFHTITKLEKEIGDISKHNQELEKVVKDYMLKEIEDKKKYEKEIIELKKTKKELEGLKANRDIYAKNIGILEEELIQMRELKQDNEDLRADIQERNALILKHNNNQIKEKHNKKKLSNTFENVSENIEFLLKEMDCKFSGYKNAYTLFEMMIYAISSSKGMDIIEDFITKSKGFSIFVNIFYNSITIKPNRKKYQVKKIFEDKIKDNLSFDESLPISLVVDTPKINSILHHIEENLALVSKDKELIDTDISYSKQQLFIKINTKIHQKNSVLQNIFRQKIVDENEQDLMICNRIIKLLGGALDSSYNDENYQYTIRIPAKIIDLNFV